MVVTVNKWLGLNLIVIVMFGMSVMRAGNVDGKMNKVHPFHVSTTEINHNAKDKTLEISVRIFVDDFESCLSKLYHTKADLSAASLKTHMDSLVKTYIVTHLRVKADGISQTIKYLGFENEDQATNVYLEADNVSGVKRVDVYDSILHDLYDDQTNIIHVIVGGERKSTRLEYPSKDVSFSF